jgi:hypothetical protein
MPAVFGIESASSFKNEVSPVVGSNAIAFAVLKPFELSRPDVAAVTPGTLYPGFTTCCTA